MMGAGWKGLFYVAGSVALIGVVLVLADIALSIVGADAGVGKLSAAGWFEYFQDNWFLGLRNLGIFNVVNLTLTIPLYLALYRAHRKGSPAAAALAQILCLVGTAVYNANNRALSMLALSDQYAAATTEAQRALFVTAGTVILAQAEDFTPGTFLGFFLNNFASILMMVVMFRGKVFRRWVGLVGLAGSSFLLFFTISATFMPAIYDLAMIFAGLGGILMVVWNLAVAVKMFWLGKIASEPVDLQTATGQRVAPVGGM